MHGDQVWLERALWMLLGAQAVAVLTQLADLMRNLLSIPQMLSQGFPGRVGGEVLWAYALWLGQYLFLGLLLVGAFRWVQKRSQTTDSFIAALQRQPGKWCASFIALSLSLSLLSMGVMLLPPLVQEWWSNAPGNIHHDYKNLVYVFLPMALHATLLPALIFWLIRRRFAPVAS